MVEYKARCKHCDKPLRAEPGPYVVYQGANFHVGCLLDYLCLPQHAKYTISSGIDGLEIWGGGGSGGAP